MSWVSAVLLMLLFNIAEWWFEPTRTFSFRKKTFVEKRLHTRHASYSVTAHEGLL